MGVQGLRKTLEEILKDTQSIEKKKLKHLREEYDVRTIGVDVMPYLYLNLNHPLKFQRVLSAMIQRITENHMIPLFVFDVRNHMDFVQIDDVIEIESSAITLHYKENTLQRRNKVRNQYKIEFQMYENIMNLKKQNASFAQFQKEIGPQFHSLHITDIKFSQLYYIDEIDLIHRMEWCEKRSWRLKNEHIQYFCMLCLQYGVPYIFSSGEADPLLANLCKMGLIQAVISEDTDMIPFGTPIVVRDFHFYNDDITIFHTEQILRNLRLTPLQMIDWCILMGNDYNNRLKGYKPNDSLVLIREHQNIETIFDILFTQAGKQIPASIAYKDIRGIYMQRIDDRYIRIVRNLFDGIHPLIPRMEIIRDAEAQIIDLTDS